MIKLMTNEARSAELAIIISYPTSASGIIVLLKNNPEILLDLADFTEQEQLADNLIVATARSWYNGSYTIAAKPIKSFELHDTMIQFLIIVIIPGDINSNSYLPIPVIF